MSVSRIAGTVVIVAFAAAGAGCYKRVVSSKGIGAGSSSVQQPYRSETAADRWFDRNVMGKGPEKPQQKTVPTMPSVAGNVVNEPK